MDINNESRQELNYEWEVVYKDGSILKQYDDLNSVEYTFGDIIQENIAKFIIKKRGEDKNFGVDLTNGLFIFNNQYVDKINVDGKIQSLGKIAKKEDEIKLIYFRRVLRTINADTNDAALKNIFHFIGWHGMINGEYEKHEIAISNNTDEVIVPPKNNFTPL